MTDAQLAAILGMLATVAGVLAAAFRWSVRRVVRALDVNSDSNIDLAKQLAVFTTRMEDIGRFVEEHTPVNQPIPRRPATPPRGNLYMQVRPRTKSDSDE